MTTFKLTNRKSGPGREYYADIELDGKIVGRVTRQQSNKMLGYRAADYRAVIDGLTVATGVTLSDLREDLMYYFAASSDEGSNALAAQWRTEREA